MDPHETPEEGCEQESERALRERFDSLTSAILKISVDGLGLRNYAEKAIARGEIMQKRHPELDERIIKILTNYSIANLR